MTRPEEPSPLEFEGFETQLLVTATNTAIRRPGAPYGMRGVVVELRDPGHGHAMALALVRVDVRKLRDFCNQWLQAHDDETPPAPEAA